MVRNNQDTLARAYAMLLSIRENIPPDYYTPEQYVREYHAALNKMEDIGKDVSEFRIPDSEIKLNPSEYSKGRCVVRHFMLTKLDAILKYFEIITSEKPKRIGFTKSDD